MSKVIINMKGLERQVKNLTTIEMNKIGLKALELNFDQISKKKNKDGSKFRPYTQDYAERKGVGVNAVDLVSKASSLSKSQKKKPYGTMLKSYNVLKLQRFKVILGFSSQWDRDKAGWVSRSSKSNNRARPFVGLMKKSRQKLFKFAFKILTRGTF